MGRHKRIGSPLRSHKPVVVGSIPRPATISNKEGDIVMSKTNSNNSNKNWFDQMLQGAAAFVLMGFAAHDVSRYVKAEGWLKYTLAVGFISFLIYTMIAPLFRK